MKYVFGADIGGTTITLGLFDDGINLIDKWEIPTDKSDKGKNIVGDVCESILAKMREKASIKPIASVWEWVLPARLTKTAL